MMSSVISFAYFTQFSNLNISGLMQIFANGKQCVYSFMELYVMQSKKSRGKNLIIIPL